MAMIAYFAAIGGAFMQRWDAVAHPWMGQHIAHAHSIDLGRITSYNVCYTKLLRASPGTPLEVVVTLEKWIKVRDRDGKLAWISV